MLSAIHGVEKNLVQKSLIEFFMTAEHRSWCEFALVLYENREVFQCPKRIGR